MAVSSLSPAKWGRGQGSWRNSRRYGEMPPLSLHSPLLPEGEEVPATAITCFGAMHFHAIFTPGLTE